MPEREVAPAVKVFYFKAFDEAGRRMTGTIEAPSRKVADAELRDTGLRPYVVHSYDAVKKVVRKRKKRRWLMGIGGPVAVVLSLFVSSWIERYAGRERAPDIAEYARTGIVEGNPGIVVAKTKELREFGGEIRTVWDSFCPGSVAGLEVSKLLMTIYVTPAIRGLSSSELEVFASNTLRALYRRFESEVCTLLVVQDETTLLEVTYNAMTKSTRVKSFR